MGEEDGAVQIAAPSCRISTLESTRAHSPDRNSDAFHGNREYSIKYWCSVCGHRFKWIHLYVLLFAFILSREGIRSLAWDTRRKRQRRQSVVSKSTSTVRAGERMPYWDRIGVFDWAWTAKVCFFMVFKLYIGVRIAFEAYMQTSPERFSPCNLHTLANLYFGRNWKMFKKKKSPLFNVIIAHRHSKFCICIS